MYELFCTLQPVAYETTKSIRIDPLFVSTSDILVENIESDIEDKIKLLDRPREHLHNIIRILGTPSEDDINYIKDENLRQYFLSLPKIEPMNWGRKLSFLKGEDAVLGIDLMKKCLEFSIINILLDPHKRIRVEEALNHPYLADVRDEKKEIKFENKFIFHSHMWSDWKEYPDDELRDSFENYVRENIKFNDF